MRPNDGRAWMALEESDELPEVGRLGSILCDVFCERKVDVVVKDDNETRFGGEIENAIEGRILEAGYFPGNLCGDKFLVNGEFADAGKDAGESLQNAADVVGGVHVRGIEAGNHGIDSGLLLFRERFVGHSDCCVAERVVVERGVAVQVIGGSAVAIDPI